MDENINLIPATQQDIYNKLLYIANNYTDVQNEDFLRSGLFGYITESMAMIMRDSSIHNLMLYNESFLNTAIIPKSIYNWAKMFNINITSATPSYADVNISFLEEDFESLSMGLTSYSEYEKYGFSIPSNQKILIIDKGNAFNAGDYRFTLEHSIAVYNVNGSYIAQYLTDEIPVTTNYEELTSPLLPVQLTTNSSGITTITVSARLYQYKLTENVKIIPSSSVIDRKIHEFEFDDQFVSATCMYKYGNEEQEIKLFFSNLDNDISNSTYYAYYSLTDTNKLQIKFPDGNGTFKPAANSELTVTILTTKGAEGNIIFTGDVECRLKEDSLKNFPLLINFVNNSSIGGVNSPSLSEIKQIVINNISTRDTIVTETDLNNFFSSLKKEANTEIKFIKKRDDILRRIFTSYIRFSNPISSEDESYILPSSIPTNTADVSCSITDMDLSFGCRVVRNGTEYILDNVNETTGDETYLIPFYTYVSLNPIRKVKYIYNLANYSTSLKYYSITTNSTENENSEDTNGQIIFPSTVEIHRNFDGTGAAKAYTLIFYFTTNFQLEETGTAKLSFFSNDGSSYGEKEVEFISTSQQTNSENEGTQVYTTAVTITINVDSSNEFSFPNNSGEEAINTISYGSFINLNFGNDPNNSLSLPEDVKLRLTLNINNISYAFQSNTAMPLFRNMDDIMNSDITLYSEDNDSGSSTIYKFKLNSVPLLNTRFLSESSNSTDVNTSQSSMDSFISQLFSYITLLKENLEKLETNTFFDLKFFNTSGISQYYNTTNTEIDLKLRVRLKEKISVEEPLVSNIRKYVRTLVSESNSSSVIRISRIIKSLIEKFDDQIENVDFEGLNGTFLQYLKPMVIPEDEKIKKLGFTPEFLNIPDKNLESIEIVPYKDE